MAVKSVYLFLFVFVTLFHYTQAIPIPLPSGAGPESLVFDQSGRGPYTGISDGRIIRWNGLYSGGWDNFATTSPHWTRDCIGSTNRSLEHKCGRPLGLQINEKSGDIYIADAYYGLMVVGPNGGMAQQLASSAEGVPFRFTNGLDIDQENGDIYFTDTSSRYDRSEYEMAMLTRDVTGRLMKYDPRTKQVSVLMRGLAFSNGVALSQDKSYLLVTETTLFRIQKYWLSGTKKGTSEILMVLPGTPDNITKTRNGEFLVAVNSPSAHALAMRIDGEGRIIEVLDVTFISQTISEVHEHDRGLFLGSVTVDHVGVF